MNKEWTKEKIASQNETATFAMGCFWGPDKFFSKLEGIVEVTVGYSGGDKDNPTYQRLGKHSETVQIIYDKDKITFEQLLEHFWQGHDPTAERKNQYKSIIFYHNPEQKELAEKSKHEIQQEIDQPIQTEIRPAEKFWPAEGYHQNYLEKHEKQYQ